MSQTLNIKEFVWGIDIEPDEFMLPLLTVIVNSIQRIVNNDYAEEGSIAI